MTVGERLKALRNARFMTQKQLSEKCGIDSANLRKYESGRQNPKHETLKKIAKALEISPMLFDNDVVSEFEFMVAVQDDEFNPMGNLTEFSETLDDLYNNPNRINQSSNSEHQILTQKYDMLNIKGKKEANRYMDYLTSQDEYTKPDEEG